MLDITNSDLQDVDSDMKKTIKEFENITEPATLKKGQTVVYNANNIVINKTRIC